MSFGKRFGQLVKHQRGLHGLTQQDLAVRAFGDESYKAQISRLENGHTPGPQQKTVDALAVALALEPAEISILREVGSLEPPSEHSNYLDSLHDFFDPKPIETLDIYLGVEPSGRVCFFYHGHLKVHLVRVNFFIDEMELVLVAESGFRRHTPMLITPAVAELLPGKEKVLFVKYDYQSKNSIRGFEVPMHTYD